MKTVEQAIAELFLQDIRKEAREAAHETTKRGVKRIREKPCQEAFIAEWTIAKMAWVDQLASHLANLLLQDALKRMIRKDVKPSFGDEADRFADYHLDALCLAIGKEPKDGLLTLFLKGFRNRMGKIQRKPSLFGKKVQEDLSPHEQVEIMDVVNNSCWTLNGDLKSVLEAIRARIPPDMEDLF